MLLGVAGVVGFTHTHLLPLRDPAKGQTGGKERIGIKVLSKSFGGLKVKALL